MSLPVEDIKSIAISGDGLEVCGQMFTNEEIRQAVDISDMLISYGYTEDNLIDFVTERFNKVGYRLYLAMHLKPEDLGAMALGEDDERILKIIHQRCVQINRAEDGRHFIVLPGEL